MTGTTILLLVSVLGWNAAHAAGALDAVDSRLVFENFPLGAGFGVDVNAGESEAIPGCRVKTFQLVDDGVPGRILVARCSEGEFGPGRIEATLAKQIADARLALAKFPAAAAGQLLAGVEPLPVSLSGGAAGKALTLPFVGHGLALVPVGYALTPTRDAAILVQAYLDPNRPRTLNQPMASLLRAIYKRLLEAGA